MSTSKLLTALRKEYQLTQKDIATRFSVSAQAVSKWERGENLPESRLLLAIARFYSISVDELLTGTRHEHHQRKKQRLYQFQFILGSFLFLVAMMLQIDDVLPNAMIQQTMSIVFLSFGAFLLVLNTNETTMRTESKWTRRLYVFTVILYFTINYLFDLWQYTWILFLIAYNLSLFMTTQEEKQY